MSLPDIHRVVTGHDANGKAIVVLNGLLPTVVTLAAVPGTVFHEIWSTRATPARVDNDADPTPGPLMLPPPAGGTRIRFVDIPRSDGSVFMNLADSIHVSVYKIIVDVC